MKVTKDERRQRMQEETEEIKFALLYAQCRKRNKNLEKQVENLIYKYEKKIADLKAEIVSPKFKFKPKKQSNAANVLQAVCEITQLTPGELASTARQRELVTARHIFFHICRNHYQISWREMADILNRDHSTAINGEKQFGIYLSLGYRHESNLYFAVLAHLNGEAVILEE